MEMFFDYLLTSVAIGITFLYGCTGEILTEKAGHLNLGIPGIMCIGGACGCLTLKYVSGMPPFFIVLLAILASFIGGALTDTMVLPLLKSGVLRKGRLVVRDPSKILLTPDTLDKLEVREVKLQTEQAARTLCVTVNPFSAYGWHFDKDVFMAKMKEAIDAPVINVREEMV